MSKKVKFTAEEKEFFVLKFRELNISLSAFCRLYNIERTVIHRWSIKYDNGGIDELKEILHNVEYSTYTLINSVQDYLTGNYSMLQIVKKYNLSGDNVLRQWLKCYNTPKWNIKIGAFMAREKISKNDKLKMVLQYINENISVKKIAAQNSISEWQLRDWIRKYKLSGEDVLGDNRGIKKKNSQLSNEEILKKRNKELENNYSIKFLCEIWSLNRRSYYKWLNRFPSNREVENKIIKEHILEIYHSVNKIYGFRRMTMNINYRTNKKYNLKRIYRLMKDELKISSVIRRKKNRYIKSSAEYKAENILNREFSAEISQQKVLTDITEFKYGINEKIYMCATFDLYDKSILSYSLSNKANTELVLKVLENSYTKVIPKNAVLHSDRGTQFTSLEYKEALEKLGITHSMSRFGKCIDNGPMEGFLGNIKSEKYYLKKYSTLDELETDISNYITFYNEDRLQKNLGCLSPLKYREHNKINVDN